MSICDISSHFEFRLTAEDIRNSKPHPEIYQTAAERFGVRHVVAVNSWTSGLVAAVGAIGIAPGDEVIVTPWTMVATATAMGG